MICERFLKRDPKIVPPLLGMSALMSESRGERGP